MDLRVRGRAIPCGFVLGGVMFLNSMEVLSLVYAGIIWLLPHVVLLLLVYIVVRFAVRRELRAWTSAGDEHEG